MLRRTLSLAAALLSTLSAFCTEKPNIIVIIADDLGYGDLGYTGSKDIRTPNIDRLAAGGMVCQNGYVTHPYCGPSRSGLMTGRYQARFGMEINLTNSPFDLYNGLPLTEQTFASRLKKGGYATGVIGKWHLGASPPFHPNNRGFDYFYGFLSGGHSYFPESVTNNHPLLLPNGEPHYSANEGCFQPLMRNNGHGEFNEYLTTALSRDAARFVSETKPPFCLYLAYNAPHQPLEAPKESIARYSHIQDKNRRIYAAMIDEMDRGIGMVTDSLKQSGKLDNTLIFFLSDNGAAGVHEKPGKKKGGPTNYSDSGPFRDGKGSMREGGSHVPFIVHWPACIRKPGTFHGLVSSLDIAATAVALGGGDTSGHELEGVNLIPYLNGEKQGSPHAALFWRKRDGASWAVRTPTTKLLYQDQSAKSPELYDMASDPYEATDIIATSPEKRAEMAKLWNDWNSKNIANSYFESGEYQKKRLKMYEKLYQEAQQAAAKHKPVIAK